MRELSEEGKEPLKLRVSASETRGNSRFREADWPDESENTSELELVSSSLDVLKGDEVISIEGGGRGKRWGKEKSKKKVGRKAGLDSRYLI